MLIARIPGGKLESSFVAGREHISPRLIYNLSDNYMRTYFISAVKHSRQAQSNYFLVVIEVTYYKTFSPHVNAVCNIQTRENH